MQEFRERPKTGKSKAKPRSALQPKQAAKVLKEKYKKQLDQRPEGIDNETTYATDQIEETSRWAVEEAVIHVPRPRKRQKDVIEEKPHSDGMESRTTQDKSLKAPNDFREKHPGQREQSSHQRQPNTPRGRTSPAVKERTTPAIKERSTQSNTPDTSAKRQAPSMPRARKTPDKAGAPVLPSPGGSQAEATSTSFGRTARPGQKSDIPQPLRQGGQGGVAHSFRSGAGKETVTALPKGEGKAPGRLRERPRTVFKTRSTVPPKKSAALSVKGRPPLAKAHAVKAAKSTAQKQMTQRMITQAQKAAKSTMKMGKKLTEATVRAAVALVGGLVGLLGGGTLLVILIFVVAIAAIASSPFGIFFSGNGGAGGVGGPTVSVPEAVARVNMDYQATLEDLQSGGYDGIEVTGQAADWPDVLAVFATRYAGAENGVDVATLDDDRVDKLTAVFWDMTDVTSYVETIRHSDSDPEDEIDDSWTEYILHITITPKTAQDMRTVYSFSDYQNSALDELLSDQAALISLAGSLTITNADVLEVLNALPVDLSPERQAAIKTALQLVGKVNYFWGGKSYVMGWDSRWGQLMKVTAGGDSTTGTYRPYGLDCTGFIDWALRNAGLSSDGHWYIGRNLTEVAWDDAQPGDIALNSDATHVGMIVGRDSTGNLLVCHCSGGANNVVVTDCAASGFTALGRPDIYGS